VNPDNPDTIHQCSAPICNVAHHVLNPARRRLFRLHRADEAINVRLSAKKRR